MITLVIGGEASGAQIDAIKEEVGPCLSTLTAGVSGSFYYFCRRVVDSSQAVSVIDNFGKEVSRRKANDNFCVHFCDDYLGKHLAQGTTLLKVATVVETALDLGLSLQVFILYQEVEQILQLQWPAHWPPLILRKGN